MAKLRISKALEEEWERKLQESGFQDAEKKISGQRVLRQAADYAFRRSEHTQVYREAKLEYFSLLSKHLHQEKFGESFYAQLALPGFEERPNFSPDKLIMERTAEGKSIQEISREMKALGLRKHNRDTIRYIRRRYEDKWGIKSWERKQMVSRPVLTPLSRSQLCLFPAVTKALYKPRGSGR